MSMGWFFRHLWWKRFQPLGGEGLQDFLRFFQSTMYFRSPTRTIVRFLCVDSRKTVTRIWQKAAGTQFQWNSRSGASLQAVKITYLLSLWMSLSLSCPSPSLELPSFSCFNEKQIHIFRTEAAAAVTGMLPTRPPDATVPPEMYQESFSSYSCQRAAPYEQNSGAGWTWGMEWTDHRDAWAGVEENPHVCVILGNPSFSFSSCTPPIFLCW